MGRRLWRSAGAAMVVSLLMGWSQPDPVPGARQADRVAVITIRGPIDAYTVRSVQRRMDLAQRSGADALVFELDTPGGAMGAALDLSALIKSSPIPNTVAWVRRDALSGGVFIALACREIVASPTARLGDAAPIQISPILGIQSLSETERQKLLVPLVTDVVDSARRNGYDEKLVQGFVSLGVELWLVEHRETGARMFVDRDEYAFLFGHDPPRTESPVVVGAAPASRALPPQPRRAVPAGPTGGRGTAFDPGGGALADLAPKISEELDRLGAVSRRRVLTEADRGRWDHVAYFSDGGTLLLLTGGDLLVSAGLASAVIETDEDLRAFFGATHVARLNETAAERVVRAVATPLTHPIAQGILVVVFIVGLFLEMASPGISVPGIVALVALVALLAPALLTGLADWWEIAVIALGVVLLGVEVFVLPGFGVFGVAGILLLFGGFLATLVDQGSVFPGDRGSVGGLATAVMTLVMAVITAGVLIWFLSRQMESFPVLGRLVLTSTSGQADDREPDGGMLLAMGVPEAVGPSVGDTGTARTPLHPVGTAMFGERAVEVYAVDGYVAAGQRVRVIGFGDLGRPLVEADAGPPEGGSA